MDAAIEMSETGDGDRLEPVIAALSNLLSEGDELDRCQACAALGRIASPRALAALLERLHDDDPDVRVDAATAIGRIGDPGATSALIKTLQRDPDGEVRVAAVEALGRIGGDAATEALGAVAANRPQNLPDDGSDWDPWWDMQLKAVQALARPAGAAALPVVETLLDDEVGQDIENELLSGLAGMGTGGVRALRRRLAAPRARQRRRAARALGACPSPDAVAALIDALADHAAEVRAAALEAIARRGDAIHLRPVLVFCRDPDPEVRRAALDAAERIAERVGAEVPRHEIEQLISADSDPRLRALALRRLAQSRAGLDEELRATVAGLLNDTDPAVASAACAVLAGDGSPAGLGSLITFSGTASRAPATRAAGLRALATRGAWNAEVADTLLHIVQGTDPALAAAALDTIGALAARTIATTRTIAEDADDTAPTSAIETLTGLLAPTPSETRIESEAQETDDAARPNGAPTGGEAEPDPGERGETAPEASGTGPVSTLEAISRASAAATLRAQAQAKEVRADPLAEMDGDDELADFARILRRNQRTAKRFQVREPLAAPLAIRCHAARVLASLPSPRAATALIAALTDREPAVCREAVAGLANLATTDPNLPGLSDALAALIVATDSQDSETRMYAVRALGGLSASAALPAVIGRLEDQDDAVRREAIMAYVAITAALGSNALDSHVERLLALVAGPDSTLQRTTASALARLLREAPARHEALRTRVARALIDAVFSGNGSDARAVAHELRRVAADAARDRLIELLATLPSSAERRHAVAMLEELYAPCVTLDPV